MLPRLAAPLLARTPAWAQRGLDFLAREAQRLAARDPGASAAAELRGPERRQTLHATPLSSHKSAAGSQDAETIQVTFIDRDGSNIVLRAPIGSNMLEVAHSNEVDLEGACEGSLACSTCHVIIEDEELYNRLPEADDDENDMLDLAHGLCETSRLGCQVVAAKELDGLVMRIPSATRNFAVDGFRPKPH